MRVGQGRIAQRYAKAVFASLGGNEKVPAIIAELKSIAQILNSHQELRYVLYSKLFPLEKRTAVLKDILEKLKCSNEAMRVILLLARAHRTSVLDLVAEKLERIWMDASQVVPVRVDSAVDLTSDEKSRLESRFQKIFGKKIEANYVMDPNLIGGVKVTAEGRVYDGTVSGWIETFREQVAEGRN